MGARYLLRFVDDVATTLDLLADHGERGTLRLRGYLGGKRRLTVRVSTGRTICVARMADSPWAEHKQIVDLGMLPVFQNRQLNEIATENSERVLRTVRN